MKLSAFAQDPKAERLLQLSDEVSRIAGSLAQLSIGLGPPTKTVHLERDTDPLDVSVETVSWMIRARRERARYLSEELFADPAWDMLLDLLRAEIAFQRVSVTSLCIASGVPATTALRWLGCLVQQGLVIRKDDISDGRRSFVELSPETSTALRHYFADVIGAGPAEAVPNVVRAPKRVAKA